MTGPVEELRPCPFCGSEVQVSSVNDDLFWCPKTGCHTKDYLVKLKNAYCWQQSDRDRELIGELLYSLQESQRIAQKILSREPVVVEEPWAFFESVIKKAQLRLGGGA